MKRIRALVVDDSAFARKVVREVLQAEPDIEVVGFARDGLEALDRIAALAPDVVTLDLVMPGLDGVGVLRALAPAPPPTVVVSTAQADSALAVEALELGAVDLVRKPTALASQQLFELSGELVASVRAAAAARPRAAVAVRPAPPTARRPTRRVDLIVVGTSTGGPQAITRLLSGLPADLRAPVAVALHIPPGYTPALAARLDETSALRVVEATHGLALEPGLVALAPGGRHLTIGREGERLTARLDAIASRPYVPSVDLLFESAARQLGARVLGVVLTGMGDDGLLGARAIAAAGGRVLAEAERSCVVYGMPRCVKEAGLASAEAPLEDMAAAVLEAL